MSSLLPAARICLASTPRSAGLRRCVPRLLLGAIALGLATPLGAVEAGVKLEQLFATPTISDVRISPDGAHVAYLAPMQGRRGVALFDVATGKTEVLVRAADEDIAFIFWKGNDYLVYAADIGGNESFACQSIHLPTRRIQRLIESWGKNNETRQRGYAGGIVSSWRENPRKIIIYGNRDPNGWYGSYYAVDVATGRREPLLSMSESERADTFDTVFDGAGRLRVRTRLTETAMVVEARLGDQTSFTRLFEQPRDALLSGLPDAAILRDSRTLVFVDYSRRDRGELVTWDLDTGTRGVALFEPPAGEITSVQLSPDRSAVVRVNYDADKPAKAWLDDAHRRTQASLDQALPTTVNDMVSVSDDERRAVVHVWSDRDPGGYFLLDRTGAKPRLMPLGAIYPQLDPKGLAPMEPVHFTARDGLELAGYLTAPSTAAPRPWPLILHPHGGPYGIRDSWEFDPEVQFLASRGYAVLQVNYRGSGGYGRRLLEAGRYEWGAKMQDDLTDAVKWAIAQGVADPRRVVISGASYGGYAALAGVTFTPELYCCAINYVGVSDLALLGEHDRGANRSFDELFYRKWIHSDPKVLRERSPLYAVAAIRVPTLHAYGRNDPRVEFRHWKYLKAELDRLHKPYEALVEGEEGHGFRKEFGRLEFYRRMEQFLAKHVPASEPAAP